MPISSSEFSMSLLHENFLSSKAPKHEPYRKMDKEKEW